MELSDDIYARKARYFELFNTMKMFEYFNELSKFENIEFLADVESSSNLRELVPDIHVSDHLHENDGSRLIVDCRAKNLLPENINKMGTLIKKLFLTLFSINDQYCVVQFRSSQTFQIEYHQNQFII